MASAPGATSRTRITFVGAGSVVFTRQLLHDLVSTAELTSAVDLEIALHDIDPGRLETARRAAEQICTHAEAPVRIIASGDRREALTGAQFVVNMVQVGGIAATRTDFEVPARYGLRQTIADTIGVGGVFRGLRTFPVLRQITDDMTEVCPDAWLLNYTNPMAMNVWWLSAAAPQIRSVGLCHSVYWTVHGLNELLGVPSDEVHYRAAGVNHQAWLLEWRHRGRDLYPALRAKIAADPQLRRRVRVDMFRRLGWYPTETSEHSSEYLPWYLHHDGEVERLRVPVDAYLGISENNVADYEKPREILDAGGSLELHDEVAEYAPQIIRAMLLGGEVTIHGNVRNTGLITNLPDGAAVEVPCAVDALGVHPQHVGDLPPQCAALNRAFLSVVELTVRAALEQDPMMVRQAVMVDPNAAATLRLDQMFDLCNDLVAAHGALMPAWLQVPITLSH
jgi:alpha-galactosidase